MNEQSEVRVRAKARRPLRCRQQNATRESGAFPPENTDAHTASSTSKTRRVFGGASIADVRTSAARWQRRTRSGDPNPIAGGTK